MDSKKLKIYLSQKLRNSRLQKSMTQAQVAKKAGMNPNAYAKIERGERQPTLETLEKICKALGVKSSDILPF